MTVHRLPTSTRVPPTLHERYLKVGKGVYNALHDGSVDRPLNCSLDQQRPRDLGFVGG